MHRLWVYTETNQYIGHRTEGAEKYAGCIGALVINHNCTNVINKGCTKLTTEEKTGQTADYWCMLSAMDAESITSFYGHCMGANTAKNWRILLEQFYCLPALVDGN